MLESGIWLRYLSSKTFWGIKTLSNGILLIESFLWIVHIIQHMKFLKPIHLLKKQIFLLKQEDLLQRKNWSVNLKDMVTNR